MKIIRNSPTRYLGGMTQVSVLKLLGLSFIGWTYMYIQPLKLIRWSGNLRWPQLQQPKRIPKVILFHDSLYLCHNKDFWCLPIFFFGGAPAVQWILIQPYQISRSWGIRRWKTRSAFAKQQCLTLNCYRYTSWSIPVERNAFLSCAELQRHWNASFGLTLHWLPSLILSKHRTIEALIVWRLCSIVSSSGPLGHCMGAILNFILT